MKFDNSFTAKLFLRMVHDKDHAHGVLGWRAALLELREAVGSCGSAAEAGPQVYTEAARAAARQLQSLALLATSIGQMQLLQQRLAFELRSMSRSDLCPTYAVQSVPNCYRGHYQHWYWQHQKLIHNFFAAWGYNPELACWSIQGSHRARFRIVPKEVYGRFDKIEFLPVQAGGGCLVALFFGGVECCCPGRCNRRCCRI